MSSTKEQTREEKIEEMESMCVMVKGKQTYLGLTRHQWARARVRGGCTAADDSYQIAIR